MVMCSKGYWTAGDTGRRVGDLGNRRNHYCETTVNQRTSTSNEWLMMTELANFGPNLQMLVFDRLSQNLSNAGRCLEFT